MALTTKKLVNLTCAGKFYVNGVPFSGTCKEVVLTLDEIAICLENKAKVDEVLVNDRIIPLDFGNYATDNGVSKLMDDIEKAPSLTELYRGKPQVETIGEKKPVVKEEPKKEVNVVTMTEEEVMKKMEEQQKPIKIEKKETETVSIEGSVEVKNTKPNMNKVKK